MGALFMKILLDPAWAARFGALTTKAQFSAAHGDWPTYFGLLTQALAVGGAIIFSLVVIWLFGREYSDHTAKDLLALPTPRATIVTAKLLLAALWCAILALWIYLLGLALGALIGLPGWTTDGWLHATAVYAATAIADHRARAAARLGASAGRGYLPAIGVTILLFFLSQVLSVLGLGPWFPWAAPALLSGAAGPAGAEPRRGNLSAGRRDSGRWNRWRHRVVARRRPGVMALALQVSRSSVLSGWR